MHVRLAFLCTSDANDVHSLTVKCMMTVWHVKEKCNCMCVFYWRKCVIVLLKKVCNYFIDKIVVCKMKLLLLLLAIVLPDLAWL